ncbi:MAG: hypothetical protein F2825_08580 [Actinobacteria bacterium]|uniref:Unannotated protein n=1 Tax=freshwater metagenome TaxID=449393 RepID=A0A6J7I3H0_9ZZZZ|nr:hypothetical protein [Actinomycetota bacterium]
MKRSELAHILRASARITGDPDILVIGSQSILGSFDEDDLPAEAWVSIEADVAFLDDADATKADQVDGAIGELSGFHSTYAYYAQGVEVTTAVLPTGWRDRVVEFRPRSAEPALARCLERHDLVVSKLIARREKDYVFTAALLDAGLVDAQTIATRLELVDDEHAIARVAAHGWLQRYLARGREL